MGRIVLLLIIAFLVYLVFRGFFRVNTRKPGADAPAVEAEDMVACSRCGVNLPRSDARLTQGLFYCEDNPRCKGP